METKNEKFKAAGAIVLLVTVFAIGRWTAPEKIKIETKIVEVVKNKEVSEDKTIKDKHKHTTIVVVKTPAGEEHTTTDITEDQTTNRDKKEKSTTDTTKNSDTIKTEEKSKSRLNIAVLAGTNITHASTTGILYGASVSRNIIGPITLGIWGLNDATGGVSIGLSF